MTHEPITSSDQGKILVFCLLFTPTVLFLIGIIPAIFLIYGIFMMKKNEDFLNIEVSVKYVKIYLYITLITLFSAFLFDFIKYNKINIFREVDIYAIQWILVGISTVFGPIFYIFILNNLYIKPLRAHRDWVVKNGIFSSSKTKRDVKIHPLPDIITSEKMQPLSVADELLKWVKLKEDGHITEQEFIDVRNKLLKKRGG